MFSLKISCKRKSKIFDAKMQKKWCNKYPRFFTMDCQGFGKTDQIFTLFFI